MKKIMYVMMPFESYEKKQKSNETYTENARLIWKHYLQHRFAIHCEHPFGMENHFLMINLHNSSFSLQRVGSIINAETCFIYSGHNSIYLYENSNIFSIQRIFFSYASEFLPNCSISMWFGTQRQRMISK